MPLLNRFISSRVEVIGYCHRFTNKLFQLVYFTFHFAFGAIYQSCICVGCWRCSIVPCSRVRKPLVLIIKHTQREFINRRQYGRATLSPWVRDSNYFFVVAFGTDLGYWNIFTVLQQKPQHTNLHLVLAPQHQNYQKTRNRNLGRMTRVRADTSFVCEPQ